MRTRLALLTVTFTFLIAAAAYACKCAPPPPPKKALENAAAVFSGKVLKIEDGGEFEWSITVEVAAAWKGVEGKEVVVKTGKNDGICGYKFEKGKSYLIYAHETTRDKVKYLATNICTRTTAWDEAEEDLKELGEGKKTR